VVQRHSPGTALDGEQPSGVLTVPTHAAITPALFRSIPRLSSTRQYRIVWDRLHPPLLWRGATSGDAPEDVVHVSAGAVLDASSTSARRAAARHLLSRSGKPQDGWLSRHVHRRVSRPISHLCLTLGLSANVATILTFLVGLVAAFCMAQTSHLTMIGGGLLFWFTSIADGVDGEVARLTLTESRAGEQLDTAVDQLTHLSGLIGVIVGWTRQGIGLAGLTLGFGVLVGTPLVLVWAMGLVRRARQSDQRFVPTKPIEIALIHAAERTGAWPLRATAAVFLLFRREAFSFAFFLLSLVTARRAAIPVAIALGLIVVAGTFTLYAKVLDRSLRETAGPLAADTAMPPSKARSAVPV
jgi:phosphatidylglycerophosphate synthase